MKRLTLLLAATLGLTACGSLNEENPYRDVFVALRNTVSSGQADAAESGNRVEITRAMVDQLPGDVLVVEAYEGLNRILMVPAVVNLNRVTWISEDNVSVVTENGLIVATRGLPQDLMAADVIESRRAILNGGGQVVRTRETLSSLDQITTELLQCSIASDGAETITIVQQAVATERFTERCDGEMTNFTNTYWVNAGGVIVQSDQNVSPEVGALRLQRP
ncbi:YjbF family lipoprotein [Salipiger sp. IMCC34102]|uniref:YjbF family lipoprotein n=1 Tax=Salipiger sp. IMCC34102 TaxID=2510647 RepID=UPI0013EDF742|nr:YjbF family lipoprotein [Salipiger sp. IMCC34102]